MQTSSIPEAALPTLTKLGGPIVPDNLDVSTIASEWLASFAAYASGGDVEGVLRTIVNSSFASNLFNAEGKDAPSNPSDVPVYWRDLLALTWDFRTFEGIHKIKEFLSSRLAAAQMSNFQLQKGVDPELQTPFPDIAWIQIVFTFETTIGLCTGIVKLVPIAVLGQDLDWKAHSVFTNLDDLKGHPEKIGALRNHEPNHGKWEAARQKETSFEGVDPTVLIIGGGQSGLDVAARLKALGVSNLIIEKGAKVGDSWRTRYEALCLHDPVWYDHMPYIPFPLTWPVFTPAKKLANWLEYYADAMELNVWTSSTVLGATQDSKTKIWSVKVEKADGTERVFHVGHVVLATGFKGGKGYVPTYPGMESFKGQVLHSLQHNKATDHSGKKVVVVGACTSAHDISVDYVENGIDVTMFQRSSTYVMTNKNGLPILLGGLYAENSPPAEIADKINASTPNLVLAGISYRATKIIAELDKEILDGLHARGFKTNAGYKDCGLIPSVIANAGGYYMDVGGSQYIIDGRIKIKSGTEIKEFTKGGLKFEDGTELAADVVVYCTGLSDPRHTVRTLFGDELAEKIKPAWGVNEEGEISGVWADSGVEGLYQMMGNLAMCRFFSKHVALQIKAVEEGLFSERYRSRGSSVVQARL